MKTNFILLLILCTGFISKAQQLNNTSFYELYSILHNPASAGSQQENTIGGSFRKQWNSMPGSPQTGLVFGQAYLPKSKIGISGYLYNDVTGPTSRTGVQLAYAYHITVKEKNSLSFGIEGRLQQWAFDKSKIQADLGVADPVAVTLANRLKADAGFGVAYNAPSFQLGASVSQLLQSKFSMMDNGNNDDTEHAKLSRHYYLHGFYKWQVDESTTVIPNFLVTYFNNAPTELQFGARLQHNDLLWYGLTWRMRQAWMITAGIKLAHKFSIGYSFDIYSTPNSIYQKGSSGHELLLNYQLK